MGVGGQRRAPAALPPGKARYLLYRRLDGPQGQSGWVWKISPPPGFDPQTIQPIASCYTDCAIPAILEFYYGSLNSLLLTLGKNILLIACEVMDKLDCPTPSPSAFKLFPPPFKIMFT